VKVHQSRETRMTWARMGLSSAGVLLLIGVIYFFLNMATRGYYEWSLRIAGLVLAIVAIVAILMIVQ
jgi:Na+/melibiose symporter-like transporter